MEFMDLFLKICECPHQHKCLTDFEKLDISVRPQGGFLGSNYWMNRVLIIGQNPGGGKAARANLGSEEDYYHTLVEELLTARNADKFHSLMKYLENSFMPKWPIFRNFDLQRHWGFGLSDIALINAVHCRTSDDKAPNETVARRCFREHTIEQINVLEPRLIICFGKKAYDFLHSLYPKANIPVKYILHPSGQYTKQHPDKQVELVRDIASFLRGKIGSRQKHHRDGGIAEDGNQLRSQDKSRERRMPEMDKDIISVQNKLKEYFIRGYALDSTCHNM